MVIAIISILMAILLPALKKAKDMAKGIVCTGNLRQISLATINYGDDYNTLPDYCSNGGQLGLGFMALHFKLVAETWACPLVGPSSDGFRVTKWVGSESGGWLEFAYHANYGPNLGNCYDYCAHTADESASFYWKNVGWYHAQSGQAWCGHYAPPVRMGDFSDPSKTISWGDVNSLYSITGSGATSATNLPSYNGGWGIISNIHGGRGNTGFMDGHAENHKWWEYLTSYNPNAVQQFWSVKK